MNSEERPATGRTAYLRIINILCPRTLSKHILHFFGGSGCLRCTRETQSSVEISASPCRGRRGDSQTEEGQSLDCSRTAYRKKFIGFFACCEPSTPPPSRRLGPSRTVGTRFCDRREIVDVFVAPLQCLSQACERTSSN
jgi:hypothetical protein